MPRANSSHRRYNPLLDEWVLCSPGRLNRPWQGQSETESTEPSLRYDPGCYLCPGNTRAHGARNPDYAATMLFDNDFPSLTPPAGGEDRGAPPLNQTDDDLLRSEGEVGRCRVLCFSPRHDLTLALMDNAGLRSVVDAWAEEAARLLSDRHIRHVQIFENKGRVMGCSNPHPHGQIWATGHVPSGALKRQASQQRYFDAHGRDLLGDYLERELQSGERIVLRNRHFVVLVPFWAVWPFETMILPLRPVSRLPDLDSSERDALADILGRLNRRYDNLFRCSFPYSMSWHAQPREDAESGYWRLHATFFPPLLRSASIRKFVVGYELSAEPQRDILAEEAAQRLRDVSDTHYLTLAPPTGSSPS